MTPTQANHEAAARLMEEMGFRVVEVHQKLPALDVPVCEHTRYLIESLIAAALSEAVRVATEAGRQAGRQEVLAEMRARYHGVTDRIREQITARSDAQATPAPEPSCPNALLPDGAFCPRCGRPRLPSGIDGGSWVHAGTPPETGEK